VLAPPLVPLEPGQPFPPIDKVTELDPVIVETAPAPPPVPPPDAVAPPPPPPVLPLKGGDVEGLVAPGFH